LKKEVQLELHKEVFKGNVLDIGIHNNGIIYNMCKHFNKDLEVEYISGKEEEKNIKDEFYDSCILFFTLNNICFNLNKRNLFKKIYNYLNEGGCLYIWDIDKGYNRVFNSNIKILLPNAEVKNINLKDLNMFHDNSKETMLKLLEEYFNLIDLEEKEGVYYIKASKKNNILNKESNNK
jgi:hypothetical protein